MVATLANFPGLAKPGPCALSRASPAHRSTALPTPPLLVLRSTAFNLFFYLWTVVYLLLTLPAFPFLSPAGVRAVARCWERVTLGGLRLIVGLDHEVRGREHLPSTPVIIAALGFIFKDESIQADRHWFVLMIDCLTFGFWLKYRDLGLHTDGMGVYIFNRFERRTALSWERYQRVGLPNQEVDPRPVSIFKIFIIQAEDRLKGLLSKKRPALKVKRNMFMRILEDIHFLILNLLCMVLLCLDIPKDMAVKPRWPHQPIWDLVMGQKLMCQVLSIFMFAGMMILWYVVIKKHVNYPLWVQESRDYLKECEVVRKAERDDGPPDEGGP